MFCDVQMAYYTSIGNINPISLILSDHTTFRKVTFFLITVKAEKHIHTTMLCKKNNILDYVSNGILLQFIVIDYFIFASAHCLF